MHSLTNAGLFYRTSKQHLLNLRSSVGGWERPAQPRRYLSGLKNRWEPVETLRTTGKSIPRQTRNCMELQGKGDLSPTLGTKV